MYIVVLQGNNDSIKRIIKYYRDKIEINNSF